MNRRAQHRSWILGIHGRAAGAALALAMMLVPAVLAPGSAQAQTYTESVLHSFPGSPDGANPYAGLVRDAQGNLYGTTVNGGAQAKGTVFKVDATGNETVLYSFTGAGGDGASPTGLLVRDAQGNLYGTTVFGGASGKGTVFKVDATGNETVLYSFTGAGGDGANPEAGVVQDAQGNLYGTTAYGGAGNCSNGSFYGCGAVFKVDTTGNETVLYSFTGTGGDGAEPAGLVRDGQGNRYGTTSAGGDLACRAPAGCGTVFKVDTTGNETVLSSFTGTGGGGAEPAGLVRDAQGNLYGTTVFGGAYGNGTVFKVDTTGNETVLYSFTGTSGDGANPEAGVVQDAQGNLYGTTNMGGDLACASVHGCGTVFKLMLGAATKTTLMSSQNPSTFGQSVTFTATVSSTSPGTISGTVNFMDGATLLGSGTVSSGKATYTTTALTGGSHSITAVYGGDSNFAGSTSNTVSQVVSEATTTTTLASSQNPSIFGQSVTFTATVSSTSPGTISGTVNFMDGATLLGSGTVSSGKATYTTTALAGGSHSITAVYGGDANFAGSTSNTVSQVVSKAATTTTLASSQSPSSFGQSVTFTAT